MDKDEARVRLIALAETTPKGAQRDALVMGANALINDIANQWLKEHDAEERAKVLDEFERFFISFDDPKCENCNDDSECACIKCMMKIFKEQKICGDL